MKIYFIPYLLLIICISANSQRAKNNVFNIMFYNVENLFDPEDDPHKNDNEFTPEGIRHWTYNRLINKIGHISQTIIASGKWNIPSIVGLCEIENRKVLNMLVKDDILSRYHYKIVHFESPDKRGIDVAAIYRADQFKLISSRPISIIYPNKPDKKTRDILYFSGLTIAGDTIHVFVNHWPSKIGDIHETNIARATVANILKSVIDSILTSNINSKIVVMGDFNDEPDSKSIGIVANPKSSLKLINLTDSLMRSGGGSHYYRGRWSVLDQIIISSALLQSNKGLSTQSGNFKVVKAEFLFHTQRNNVSVPFRTYSGQKYLGGYSDHLPIILELNY